MAPHHFDDLEGKFVNADHSNLCGVTQKLDFWNQRWAAVMQITARLDAKSISFLETGLQEHPLHERVSQPQLHQWMQRACGSQGGLIFASLLFGEEGVQSTSSTNSSAVWGIWRDALAAGGWSFSLHANTRPISA